jgi:hypothetical protein
MSELTAVLEAVHSPCAATRHAAEAQLEAMERDNLATLLLCLVQHLAAEVRSPAATKSGPPSLSIASEKLHWVAAACTTWRSFTCPG